MSIKTTVAILYTPSELTPWKENINQETIDCLSNNLPDWVQSNSISFQGFSHSSALLLKQYDLVLNVCYGYYEADQVEITKWLSEHSIHHTGSDPETMLIAQDKSLLPDICSHLSLNTPSLITELSMINEQTQYIYKPRFGSCHRNISILSATEARSKLENPESEMLLQPYILGREFSLAIIPSENIKDYIALKPVEILPKESNDFFIAGNSIVHTTKNFSPDITVDEEKKLMESALNIHNYLGLSCMSRIDIRMNDKGDIFILDINTLPNLDPDRSLLPKICIHQGINYSTLLDRVMKMALKLKSKEV